MASNTDNGTGEPVAGHFEHITELQFGKHRP